MIDHNKIEYKFSTEFCGATVDLVSYPYVPSNVIEFNKDVYIRYVTYLDKGKTIEQICVCIGESVRTDNTFNIGRVPKEYQEISVELKKAYSLIKSSSISDLII